MLYILRLIMKLNVIRIGRSVFDRIEVHINHK